MFRYIPRLRKLELALLFNKHCFAVSGKSYPAPSRHQLQHTLPCSIQQIVRCSLPISTHVAASSFQLHPRLRKSELLLLFIPTSTALQLQCPANRRLFPADINLNRRCLWRHSGTLRKPGPGSSSYQQALPHSVHQYLRSCLTPSRHQLKHTLHPLVFRYATQVRAWVSSYQKALSCSVQQHLKS